MDTISQNIQDNILGRQAAEKAIAALKSAAEKLCPKAKTRFWECIKETVDEKLPIKKLEPMSDKECRSFEDEEMEFGQYAGKLIEDVPLDYLEWLADTETRHARQLTRYLQSKRIKQERK